MRGSRGGALACMRAIWFIVLFGRLALPAQCRPQLLDVKDIRMSYTNSLANTSTNATAVRPSLDDTKLKVIFCVVKPPLCATPPCICCIKTGKCFFTDEDCKEHCPACDPVCPPPPPAVEG
ncbi:hypothetical protein ACP70R_043295 [Stipagrostis hirtigluma subsp. patula]